MGIEVWSTSLCTGIGSRMYEPTSPAITDVIITNVDMSIGAMCKFMVKWAIAAIPGSFIVSAIFGVGR